MPKNTPVRRIDQKIRTTSGLLISATGGGVEGVTDHGALTGLADDDHTQYYNQSRGDARYVRGTRALTAGAGLTGGGDLSDDRDFAVGAGNGIIVNANDVALASSTAGAGLTFTTGVLAVGAGNGITVNADDVALSTPGTLTVSTSNSASAHTHAITSSSAPGAAVSLLASDASGQLTLPRFIATTGVRTPLIDTASGSMTLSPTGSAVLPTSSIVKDLGDYNRKWRSLYAAELYVETLVAQDVLATIGGRIMVAPTTTLIADLSSGATTIDVKHNNLHSGSGGSAVGAYVYMASAPGGIAQVEVLKVANGANPTAITGGYRYTVARNQDGSGANAWVSGDALANIGSVAGQGYIDLTSTNTVHSHLGPTVTIYSRTGMAAWTNTKPVVSLGNLRSFVDYGSDEFGFALGNDLTLTPTTGFAGMTGDRTNGLRMFNTPIRQYSGSTNTGLWDSGGNLLLSNADVGTANNRAFWFDASTGNVRIGKAGTGVANLLWDVADSSLALRVNTTDIVTFDSDGLGIQSTAYAYDDQKGIKWRNSGGSTRSQIVGWGNSTNDGIRLDAMTDGMPGSSYGTLEVVRDLNTSGNGARLTATLYSEVPSSKPRGTISVQQQHAGVSSYLYLTPYESFSSVATDGGASLRASSAYGGYAEVTLEMPVGLGGKSTFYAVADHFAFSNPTGNVFHSRTDATDSFLRLGFGNTNDRASFLDLFANGSAPTTYDARMVRNPGANGSLQIANRGTGAMQYIQLNLGVHTWNTNGSEVMRIHTDNRVGIGTSAPDALLDVAGFARALSLIADGDGGSVSGATVYTNGYSTTISSGVGNVRTSGTTARTNTHWVKMYVDGTTVWVPAWTTITG